MADIYSVKYPIELDIVGEYTIQNLNGEIIYVGYSYKIPTDISSILQDYLNSDLINISEQDFEVLKNNTIQEFTIVNNDTEYSIFAAYDYNIKYRQFIEGNNLLSYEVTSKYHPDQLLFLDYYSQNSDAVIVIGENTYQDFNSISISAKDDIPGKNYRFLNSGDTSLSFVLITLVYGANKYIAFGINQQYTYAGNDLIFQTRDIGTSAVIYDIIFANNTFVGVGSQNSNGFYCESTDGITWNSGQINLSGFYLRSIAYGNGIFVAVGDNSRRAITQNLIDWETGLMTSSNNTSYYSIAYGNGIFVAVGNNGHTAVSNNGIDWELSNVGEIYEMTSIIFDGEKFVAVGGATLAVSNNGIDWENISIDGAGYPLTSIAYGNSYYMVVSGIGRYSTSKDLINWDAGNTDTGLSLRDVIFDGEKFVAVGNNGKYYVFTLQDYGVQPIEILINGENYPIELTAGCEEYALYFINREGGRCSFLIPSHAKVTKRLSTNFDRYKGAYDLLNSRSFENKTIAVDEVSEYTFNTTWLTDEEYLLLEPIFSSPKIWIHDFRNDIIKSAQLNMTTAQINNYRHNRISNNQISIIEAQQHLRR